MASPALDFPPPRRGIRINLSPRAIKALVAAVLTVLGLGGGAGYLNGWLPDDDKATDGAVTDARHEEQIKTLVAHETEIKGELKALAADMGEVKSDVKVIRAWIDQRRERRGP